jgi:hypothetical protein
MIQKLFIGLFVFQWVCALVQRPTIDPLSAYSTWTPEAVLPAILSSHVKVTKFFSYRLSAQEIEPVDDEYLTNQSEELSVDPPGVMENDITEIGVNAVLVEPGPLNGEITLNPNGSFTYTPEAEFIGVDTFTYRLELDDVFSEPAIVRITVLDTQPPQVEWLSPIPDGEVLIVGFKSILLEVGATDNGVLTGVQFYRWDSLLNGYLDIALIEAAPYQFELNTMVLNPGWNQIFARAFDEAGNVSERSWIWVFLVPRFYFPIIFR